MMRESKTTGAAGQDLARLKQRLNRAGRRIRCWLGLPTPPDDEFLQWCNRTKPAAQVQEFVVNSGQFQHPPGNPNRGWEKFHEQLNHALNPSNDSAYQLKIVIVHTSLPDPPLRLKANKPSPDQGIYELRLTATDPAKPIYLDSANVFRATLANTHAVFENCRLTTLTISGNSTPQSVVALRNTRVGKLVVESSGLSRLEIVGGSVSEIAIDPPGGGNPFTGWVWISKTWFPTHKEMVQGSQPYRSMRHHLKTLGNMPMADLFHALELRTERRHETSWTNRLFNYLYEAFSDFGSSIARPIRWLIWIGTLVALILYWQDGAVPAAALERSAIGWQSVLTGNGNHAPIWRAAYLSFYTVTHPLGIFSGSSLLVGRTPAISIMLFVEGILSLVLITLTIFAIRRRFKLTQS